MRKDYLGWKLYYFEKASYVMIWLIPIALVLIARPWALMAGGLRRRWKGACP